MPENVPSSDDLADVLSFLDSLAPCLPVTPADGDRSVTRNACRAAARMSPITALLRLRWEFNHPKANASVFLVDTVSLSPG